MMKPKIMAKKEMSKFGDSSEEHGSLRVASYSPCHYLFANNLPNTAPSTPSAVIDEDRESCQDDTAIDTDDTDWEDSNEEGNRKSGGDEPMAFQRIQLRVNPPPKRESLITLALQSTQHHGSTPRLGHAVPKSTFTDVQRAKAPFSSIKVSPGESGVAPIRIRQKPSGAARQSLNDIVRSSAQPIPLTSNSANEPVVFSPRMTRHNMLATELTEWLSRHLHWERKEKNLTANAVLKRRHTHGDVTTLDQSPQRPHITQDTSDIGACSWDQDFTWEALGGYHTKGW